MIHPSQALQRRMLRESHQVSTAENRRSCSLCACHGATVPRSAAGADGNGETLCVGAWKGYELLTGEFLSKLKCQDSVKPHKDDALSQNR